MRSVMAGTALAPHWSARFTIPEKGPLVWTDGAERVLVHVDSLRVEQAGRWPYCDLDVEPVRARRRRIRVAFLAVVNRAGDTILAEAVVYGRRLSERCGNDIQQALKGALS